eukprot:jgi/Tetstr1/465328/TSEL_000865.t1
MKVRYDDDDSEELTESEIQPLYVTTEQLSAFTRRRRQLYTGADATLMEAALNLCEQWKLKHNIKAAAFERLSKLLKKHMLPKDGSELTETWYQDMRPKKKKMDMQMALVTLSSHFGRPVRPMLPSVVCEECRRVNEYIKKQREEGFSCLLTYAQMCVMHLPDDRMKLNLHNLVCRVRALDAARGSTARDSELWMERTVVDEKPETRRHVVFEHKTWDEQWVPTDEYGKQAILRDRRAEVEQHGNHVYVGEVMYFLGVTHTGPLVPDLTLAVCRLHATFARGMAPSLSR